MAHSFHLGLLDSRLYGNDGSVIAPLRHSGEGRNPETACNDDKEEIMLPAESIIYALQRNWDMVDSALEDLDEAARTPCLAYR